jgi:hypothetical protein
MLFLGLQYKRHSDDVAFLADFSLGFVFNALVAIPHCELRRIHRTQGFSQRDANAVVFYRAWDSTSRIATVAGVAVQFMLLFGLVSYVVIEEKFSEQRSVVQFAMWAGYGAIMVLAMTLVAVSRD